MSLVFQQAADAVALTTAGTHATAALSKPAGNSAPIVASVFNADDEGAFIVFGDSNVEAGPTSVAIGAGERAFFMVPGSATHVSIESVGTGGDDVYVTLGYVHNGR